MANESVHISMSKEMKKELINEAKEKGLTLNGYIRMILLARKT